MQDLSGFFEKIRLLKNQIYVGLKDLTKIKENKDCTGKGFL